MDLQHRLRAELKTPSTRAPHTAPDDTAALPACLRLIEHSRADMLERRSKCWLERRSLLKTVEKHQSQVLVALGPFPPLLDSPISKFSSAILHLKQGYLEFHSRLLYWVLFQNKSETPTTANAFYTSYVTT